MTPNELHPSELAYAFAFAKVETIVGWGDEPFQPPGGDGQAWATEGGKRLLAAGRLVGEPGEGLNFTPEMTSVILALVNPSVVLMAQAKAGDGVRKLTVHIANTDFVGLTHNADGMFEMARYADLTAAAAACATFAGATLEERDAKTRLETTRDVLQTISRLARSGDDSAVATLTELGVPEPEAESVVDAMAAPTAAGVLSVLYCQDNVVLDIESFSLMTNAQEHSWIIFAPAGDKGPTILERSSVGELTARVAVGIAARLSVAA